MPTPRRQKNATSRREFVRAVGLGTTALALLSRISRAEEAKPKATSAPRTTPTMWSGAVTTDAATVKAKIVPGMSARVVVTREGSKQPRLFFDCRACAPGSTIGAARITGLDADTAYTYALEIGGKPSVYPRGTFRTFPEGPASFNFAFASCARTGSAHAVFETIRKRKPLFFHHLGDLHYSNISKNNFALFQAAYDTVFASPTQAALYRSVSLAYIWDDHDFGPNDSDSTSPAREVSRLVYREYIPHYPLPAGDGDAPIYQAFNVGRVRFLSLDLRSERTPVKTADGPEKSILGKAQKAWLKRELLAARDRAGLVFMVSSVPWSGRIGKVDGWSTYATERREIADFIKANRIRNVCILCGDAHMLAADDGTNSDFATGGGAPVPVLHGSSLDQGASYKGGPYSEGWYLPKSKEGCFGWVEVRDNGSEIAVDFTGRNHLDIEKVRHSFRIKT